MLPVRYFSGKRVRIGNVPGRHRKRLTQQPVRNGDVNHLRGFGGRLHAQTRIPAGRVTTLGGPSAQIRELSHPALSQFGDGSLAVHRAAGAEGGGAHAHKGPERLEVVEATEAMGHHNGLGCGLGADRGNAAQPRIEIRKKPFYRFSGAARTPQSAAPGDRAESSSAARQTGSSRRRGLRLPVIQPAVRLLQFQDLGQGGRPGRQGMLLTVAADQGGIGLAAFRPGELCLGKALDHERVHHRS